MIVMIYSLDVRGSSSSTERLLQDVCLWFLKRDPLLICRAFLFIFSPMLILSNFSINGFLVSNAFNLFLFSDESLWLMLLITLFILIQLLDAEDSDISSVTMKCFLLVCDPACWHVRAFTYESFSTFKAAWLVLVQVCLYMHMREGIYASMCT